MKPLAIDTFLTPEELYRLTGAKSREVQCEYLSSRGWRFETDRVGSPLVARAYFHARMVEGGINRSSDSCSRIRLDRVK